MQISADIVKELREKTGAGVMDCKKALEEAGGNMQKAAETLKERGLALAKKKAERVANQGLIECYVHQGGQIGVMVEVNCETDFVARTNEFKNLAHDIALQIAALSPQYIGPDEVTEETGTDTDTDTQAACLLLQPFIKDPTKTIQDLITETIAKVGENIKIRRFCRFELGY
ncbi:MAG: translation elongation factor Ts [Chloroflexi bacterium]|nr:translation elongation factor Ts [Chloroflexota bacterium]MBM3153811.1 translation elongation factor Ts [Chloroflexota bacterium]MBM3173462.1 translation elongation factor Ts [Chloroflexota bacterium]MBM3174421.1 translation elongation factor Ts [Chloroflexota bacterium]MBM4449397.1 translation elongation factor Ts [Chloroflexota bacterium]